MAGSQGRKSRAETTQNEALKLLREVDAVGFL